MMTTRRYEQSVGRQRLLRAVWRDEDIADFQLETGQLLRLP